MLTNIFTRNQGTYVPSIKDNRNMKLWNLEGFSALKMKDIFSF